MYLFLFFFLFCDFDIFDFWCFIIGLICGTIIGACEEFLKERFKTNDDGHDKPKSD